MKIITTAGYYSTGSSAVTDFFSEFDNIHSVGTSEIRLAHELDGLSDLEYYVAENNHKVNTSNEIKRFIKLCKRLNGTWYQKGYCAHTKNTSDFMNITMQFIDDITELKALSMCSQDAFGRGDAFVFLDRLYNKFRNMLLLFHKAPDEVGNNFSLLKGREYGYFTSISDEDFLKAVRKYTSQFMQALNKDDAPYLLVDQLLPPSNLSRYLRYFPDTLVIVVDRDPRDLYIEEKLYHWGRPPVETVDAFCNWYRIIRKHRETDAPLQNVLEFRFEDLIYHYGSVEKTLADFVDIDISHHTRRQEIFNPSISVRNTNMVQRYPVYADDIRLIEERLPEYLYPFESVH